MVRRHMGPKTQKSLVEQVLKDDDNEAFLLRIKERMCKCGRSLHSPDACTASHAWTAIRWGTEAGAETEEGRAM